MPWDWVIQFVQILMISLIKVGLIVDYVFCMLVCFALERVYHEKSISLTRRRLKQLRQPNPPYSRRRLQRMKALNDKIIRHERAIWRNRHFS